MPAHALRPTRWSVLVVKDGFEEQVREFQWAEDGYEEPDEQYVPPFPWLPGHPDWADPHAVDRRAIASFFGAADADLVGDWAALARRGNFDIHGLGQSRAQLIREWCGQGDMVYPDRFGYYTEEMLRANQASDKAAGYLHQRGFSLTVLADLAVQMRDLVADLGLGTGTQGEPVSKDRPDDDLDRVLYALAAGLSGPEIEAGLSGGGWPDPAALSVMAALR